MSRPSSAASKSTVVDAIVLAFAHSDASELVGTDALRSVLNVEYHDMLSGTELDLTGLLELLQEQPGFHLDMAVPPMCALKTWEGQLGLEIKLPDALGELADKDVGLNAASCRVPSAELRRLLRIDVAAEASKKPARPKGKVPTGPSEPEERKRMIMMIGAAVVALACFVFVGIRIVGAMSGPPSWDTVSPEQIEGLEVATAKRFADQVGVTLSSADWYTLPETDKKGQLKAALDALRDKGVNVLFVKDGSGRVRATVQVSSATGQTSFTFQ